jgi:hypothetical protein
MTLKDSQGRHGRKIGVILNGQLMAIVCDDDRPARVRKRRKADPAWRGRFMDASGVH